MYEISRENEKIKKKKKWIGAIDPLPLHFFHEIRQILFPFTSLSLFTFKFFSSKKKSVHRVYKFINVLERGVFNPR